MDIIALEPWHVNAMIDSRPPMTEGTKGLTVMKKGQVQAVCVLDSWSDTSCMIHIWIGNPMVLKNGFAEEIFNYVFNTAGKLKIIGSTPSDNLKALKFIKHIGFEELYRIKDGYRVGVDYVLTEINKDTCRFISHGKESASTT